VIQMDLGVVALPVAVPEHAMPRLRYDEYATRLVAANYSTTVRADEFTVDIPEGEYVPDRLRRRSRRPAAADGGARLRESYWDSRDFSVARRLRAVPLSGGSTLVKAIRNENADSVAATRV